MRLPSPALMARRAAASGSGTRSPSGTTSRAWRRRTWFEPLGDAWRCRLLMSALHTSFAGTTLDTGHWLARSSSAAWPFASGQCSLGRSSPGRTSTQTSDSSTIVPSSLTAGTTAFSAVRHIIRGLMWANTANTEESARLPTRPSPPVIPWATQNCNHVARSGCCSIPAFVQSQTPAGKIVCSRAPRAGLNAAV